MAKTKKEFFVYEISLDNSLKQNVVNSKKEFKDYEFSTFMLISTNKLDIPKSIFSRKGHETFFSAEPKCKVNLTKEEFSSFYKMHELLVTNIGNIIETKLDLNIDFQQLNDVIAVPKFIRRKDKKKSENNEVILQKEVVKNTSIFELWTHKELLDYLVVDEYFHSFDNILQFIQKELKKNDLTCKKLRQIFLKFGKNYIDVKEVTDERFLNALKIAENISSKLENLFIKMSYSDSIYLIEYVDFLNDPKLTIEETPITSYFKQKITQNEEMKIDDNQPLLKCMFPDIKIQIKKWSKLGISSVHYHIQEYYNQFKEEPEKSPPILKVELFQLDRQLRRYVGVLLLPQFCQFTNFDLNVITWSKSVGHILIHIKEATEHYKLINQLETIIGVSFQNKLTIRQALTHSTFSNELQAVSTDNQTLEYLGDSLLEYFASHFVFENFTDATESILSKFRVLIVQNSNLQRVARALKLTDYVLCSNSQRNLLLPNSMKLSADLLESLIGAIFLDQNLNVAHEFTKKFLLFKPSKLVKTMSNKPHQSYEIPIEKEIEMNKADKSNILKLEKILGFEFKNKFIVLEALTHQSMKNSSNTFEEYKNTEKYPFDNERLEFLGDAIVKAVVGSYLYLNFPNTSEGSLTLMRQEIIGNSVSLLGAAKKLNIFQHMRCEYRSNKVAADCIEALIGAIYIDKGGLHTCKNDQREFDVYGDFIHKYLIEPRLDSVQNASNPDKNTLQECVQVTFEGILPVYTTKATENGKVLAFVKVLGIDIGFGVGKTKKESECMAAKNGIEYLRTIGILEQKKISMTRKEFILLSSNFKDSLAKFVDKSIILNAFDLKK
eukprot:gene7147-11460_t